MKDPIEVLTDDGDVQLMYTTDRCIIITDSEGTVLRTIHLLPGFKDGLHYEQ
jgi:hypothetical protein